MQEVDDVVEGFSWEVGIRHRGFSEDERAALSITSVKLPFQSRPTTSNRLNKD